MLTLAIGLRVRSHDHFAFNFLRHLVTMGAYLSKPKTDIEIEIGGNANLTYCCASMQGWRLHQEDAHNTIPNFDEECSLFAVYDGHGGAEVAQYASQNFPNFLKKLPIWSEQEKDFKKAFEDAFIGFDDRLRQPEVMRALSEIAAENKRGQNVEDEEEEIDEEELDSEKPQLMQEARLPLREVLGKYGVDSKDFMNIVMNYANQQMRKKEGTVKAEDADAPGPSGSAAGSSTRPTKRAGSPPPSNAKVEANGSASAHQENEEPKNESADKEADEAEKEEEDEESEDEDEEAEDGEDKSENGPGPSRAPLLNVDRFLRDVSGDSDSDEDYDEETDEAEAEEFIGAPIPGGGEIPGDDSGATACVVAVYKDKLVIANAGDSRAVLCRKKEAVDLSLDHKPEDDIERRRIYAAGGTISGDGRVNGGLNLSRALGDHFYKKNISIPLKDQMISALPDVKIETLTEDDTFLVVACDGIWNSMSSQQVINFVKERLDNGGELRFICEEICRHCLAEDTEGDGTGCDNITFMIVKLNTPYIAPPEDEEYAEKTAVEEKTPVEAEEAAVEAEEAAVEQE
ncbi:hypothetical protein L596_018053 [Steinernema carpocapsae]|uniref:protein-serine/threonine phosphatase n=1 Tax=Steinernema carpocapsae TaxID=34508 RepID=A0A4U5N3X1_STECR|nr:hypothetical protein L596_018053 [Steinernema carpocapsae]